MIKKFVIRNTRQRKEDLKECIFGALAGLLLTALFFLAIIVQPYFIGLFR
ncbi:MAG: hypothetical protein PHW34_15210 [Hespellia sp.]|nr:hypothetical protein [Hespellia sp.]